MLNNSVKHGKSYARSNRQFNQKKITFYWDFSKIRNMILKHHNTRTRPTEWGFAAALNNEHICVVIKMIAQLPWNILLSAEWMVVENWWEPRVWEKDDQLEFDSKIFRGRSSLWGEGTRNECMSSWWILDFEEECWWYLWKFSDSIRAEVLVWRKGDFSCNCELGGDQCPE